jgi:PAS domain S-box-containing protein
MNHVPTRWLQRLHLGYITTDIVLLAGFAYLHLVSVSAATTRYWGMTPLIGVLLAIHLLYGLAIYPWYQKKNVWVATLLSQVLFDFIFAAIIETTFEANLYYRVGWGVTIGASAMLGVFPLITEAGIDILWFLLSMAGVLTTPTGSTLTELLLLTGDCSAAFIGWLLFRRYYQKNTPDELEKTSQLLKRERSRSNLIIESIADGVVVFDTNGKINFMNPAAAALTEWPVTEALDIDVHNVIKLSTEEGEPLEHNDDLFGAVLNKQQRITQTLQLIGRNGKPTVVSLVVSPILVPPNDEIVGAVVMLRDVTAQRQEDKQRTEFISTASHEMRTPVAAIEGYLALAMNDKVSTIDPKARDYLTRAHEATQHLGQLFADLLTSAKAEDGRFSNHPEVVEMGEFLEKLTADMRFAAQDKRLAVEFVVGSNKTVEASSGGGNRQVRPLYYVYVDPDRIREVVTNLFDNAVKYTDRGTVSLGLTGDDRVVQLWVRDTGAGIPAEDIPHLFQKFYRVDSSATRTVGGTGLGLFICRKIIELYQGRIWVESKLGSGSTFYINLPRLSTQRAEQLGATNRPPATVAATPRPSLASRGTMASELTSVSGYQAK